MVRVRESAVNVARQAAAKLGVPLIDVLSHGASMFAASVIAEPVPTPAEPAAEVLTVAEAKRLARKGKAAR